MKVLQNGEVLFDSVKTADTFALRFLGLMPKKTLQPSEGLLLKNCSRIHTNFMRFTIDVIYLSKDGRVLDTETVKPWRLGKRVDGTENILEVPENGARKFKRGEPISTEE